RRGRHDGAERPPAEEALSRPVDTGPELRVWPADGLQAIFRFCTPEEVFDVDLRELQGQERLDLFCDFLSAIGRRLGRPVLMGPRAPPAARSSATTPASTASSACPSRRTVDRLRPPGRRSPPGERPAAPPRRADMHRRVSADAPGRCPGTAPPGGGSPCSTRPRPGIPPTA